MGRLTWTRRYSFQSVHLLESGALRERRHGHRYFLEVTFSGREVNAVDEVVEREVLRKLHGHEVLEIHPSTGENIVEWIDSVLRDALEGAGGGTSSGAGKILAVALQETRKNRFISSRSELAYV